MRNISNNLIKNGFDQRFLDNVDPESLAGFEIARVMAVHKDSYMINNGEDG